MTDSAVVSIAIQSIIVTAKLAWSILVLRLASGLFVAPKLAATPVSLSTGSFLAAVLLQVAVGLTLGFVALILFSAIQAAGQLIDLSGGLSLAQAFDPFSNVQSSVFGRFYQILAI